MTGLIETENGRRYIFRNDHGFEDELWAWDIDNPDIGWRTMRHRWPKPPKGSIVTTFDIDNPPATVSYLPIIN